MTFRTSRDRHGNTMNVISASLHFSFLCSIYSWLCSSSLHLIMYIVRYFILLSFYSIFIILLSIVTKFGNILNFVVSNMLRLLYLLYSQFYKSPILSRNSFYIPYYLSFMTLKMNYKLITIISALLIFLRIIDFAHTSFDALKNWHCAWICIVS